MANFAGYITGRLLCNGATDYTMGHPDVQLITVVAILIRNRTPSHYATGQINHVDLHVMKHAVPSGYAAGHTTVHVFSSMSDPA